MELRREPASRDLEQFALEAARPAWPRVPDVTRDELIELVRRVRAGQAAGDPGADYHLLVLEVNVAHPRPFGVIEQDAPPERIVDELLAHRPIAPVERSASRPGWKSASDGKAPRTAKCLGR
ncbi:hypothetical protein [Streptomyces barringtoniae]|uniref:hypothetical protein n=1 Tax=Streptomyces barringtoniae TaxID=2892029 RepID=UPI001E484110|nr:hypothetical protein [Streptomyces barringtoniae]MCC5477986.1 hypothetical protein [Streptomyces barringtoniae]